MRKAGEAIKLFLLGLPHILQQGEVTNLKQRKGVALLTYLALNGVAQPREKLIGLLWAESTEEAARKNLRNLLWAIRKDFGPDLVVGEGDESLALSESVWVDAAAFQMSAANPEATADSEQILTLYRGDLLESFQIRDAPEFEQWLLLERERLQQLFLHASRRLLYEYRGAQRWPELVKHVKRTLTIDPLQEEMHRLLIESLALQGDRNEALRQFERLKNVLWQELGVEPIDKTIDLVVQIRSGEFAEAHINQPDTADSVSSQIKEPTLNPFIGQQLPLHQLDDAFSRTHSGNACITIIKGEMGIGKTRLWGEWAQRQTSAEMFATGCLPSTQAMPFFPLISLFRSHPRLNRLISSKSQLEDVWLIELARLLPEIVTTFPHLPPSQVNAPEEDRLRLFQALTHCFDLPSHDPLIVFIDDAHWIDQATIDWLSYFVHQLKNRPVMLSLSFRGEEIRPQLKSQIANWKRLGLVSEINLMGLDEMAALELIQKTNPNAPNPFRIWERGRGNPLFLIELSQSPNIDIPLALKDLIQQRLDNLSDVEQQVVETAVIVEPLTEFDILQAVSGRHEDELLLALDRLLANGILHESQQRYEFVHPLLAEVTRDNMSATRLRILNRRSGRVLQHHFANRLPEVASHLARHFALAQEPDLAGQFAELAGDHALSVAALNEAADYFQRSLKFGKTAARQNKLGRVNQLLGDLETARSFYQQAVKTYQEQLEPHASLRVKVDLAETFIQSGQPDVAQEMIEQMFQLLDGDAPADIVARAHVVWGSALLRNGEALAASQTQFEKAFQLAAEHNLPALAAYARFEEGNVAAQQDALDQAHLFQQEAIDWAKRGGDVYMQTLATNNLAYYLILNRQLNQAEQMIREGLDLVEKHGLQLPLQYLYSTFGELFMAREAWDEAADWFNKGMAEARSRNNWVQVANYQANLGLVARGQGNDASALSLFDSALKTLDEYDSLHLRLQIEIWRVETYLLGGETQSAKKLLSEIQGYLSDSSRQLLKAQADRLANQIS
ncbi:MAG: AAA family ATPase [Chloroflexota bacterium]